MALTSVRHWGNVSHFDTPLVAISGFPGWATLPGSQWLAMGRRWHFFFAWLFVANGVAYAALSNLIFMTIPFALMPQGLGLSSANAANICVTRQIADRMHRVHPIPC